MSQSEQDMRMLSEMAEEIEEHGYCTVSGSHLSYIKTKRAKRVGAMLKSQAFTIMSLRAEIKGPIALQMAALMAENNGLRDSMHEMSTELAARLNL